MAEITYYGIAELDSNGKPIEYPPQPRPGQNPDTIESMTASLAEAWPIADKQRAEEHADVLNANYPGRNLGRSVA